MKPVTRNGRTGRPAAAPAEAAKQAVGLAAAKAGLIKPKRAERSNIAVAPAPAVTEDRPPPAVAEHRAAEHLPARPDTIDAATSPATSSDPISADPIAPTKEGFDVMATISPTPSETVGVSSEKLQSMFGDVGARFKASFEKSSKLGEEMVDLAKGNVEAVVASARVAAKGSEALGQDAAEYSKKSLESAVAVMKSFASVKSPTELFQLQSDYAKTAFDSAVAEASKFSESMMKLAGDVSQPISTRYAIAAEKIKAVAN